MGAYDSSVFFKFLPRLKIVAQSITHEERERLGQTLRKVWSYFFNIGEPKDLGYILGGLFYDLGYYQDALAHFQFSENDYGPKVDTFYNRILCYYQLREDTLFTETLAAANTYFPDNPYLAELEKLDLSAT